MGTLAEKLQKLIDTKNSIKAAIIAKGQTIADSDTFASYADKISAIETGIDTSDATATASDILIGETAYVNGEKVEGTIPIRSASNMTVDGPDVTIVPGYYDSRITKGIAATTQATPVITINSDGVVKATSTQRTGYVSGGTTSSTKELSTRSARTIVPSTSNQTIPSGIFLTGTQTIKGDSNLVADNIKSGVSIFGINGALSEGIDTSDATATASDIADGVTAYVNGEKVTGNLNVVAPPNGYTLSYLTESTNAFDLNGKLVFSVYADTQSDVLLRKSNCNICTHVPCSRLGDATAADVALGKTFTSAAGLKVTGTMDSGARKQANIAVYNEATTSIIIFYVNDGVSTRISLASGSPTSITPDQGSYFVIYGLTKQIQPQTESGPTMIYDDGNAHYHVPDGLTNGTVWVENFS